MCMCLYIWGISIIMHIDVRVSLCVHTYLQTDTIHYIKNFIMRTLRQTLSRKLSLHLLLLYLQLSSVIPDSLEASWVHAPAPLSGCLPRRIALGHHWGLSSRPLWAICAALLVGLKTGGLGFLSSWEPWAQLRGSTARFLRNFQVMVMPNKFTLTCVCACTCKTLGQA